MARRLLVNLYDEARAYLDTDELNFPDDLCHTLMRRVWFQAVNMEPEWRFLLHDGRVSVAAQSRRVPMSFTVPALAGQPVRSAARLAWVRWDDRPLTEQSTWRETEDAFGSNLGIPTYWTEEADAGQRYLRLAPIPVADGDLSVSMVLIPEFPLTPQVSLVDLPEEFDDALLQALLAEMYMREEDADLYQFQRSMFMEQMGSIKQRWRTSTPKRLVHSVDGLGPMHRRPDKPRLTGGAVWP